MLVAASIDFPVCRLRSQRGSALVKNSFRSVHRRCSDATRKFQIHINAVKTSAIFVVCVFHGIIEYSARSAFVRFANSFRQSLKAEISLQNIFLCFSAIFSIFCIANRKRATQISEICIFDTTSIRSASNWMGLAAVHSLLAPSRDCQSENYVRT